MEDSKVAVLLEDIRSQIRIFGEGLQMLDEKFSSKFQEMDVRFDRMDVRFDRMESRFNSFEHQNQQEHRFMMQMIRELGEEQLKLKKVE